MFAVLEIESLMGRVTYLSDYERHILLKGIR